MCVRLCLRELSSTALVIGVELGCRIREGAELPCDDGYRYAHQKWCTASAGCGRPELPANGLVLCAPSCLACLARTGSIIL